MNLSVGSFFLLKLVFQNLKISKKYSNTTLDLVSFLPKWTLWFNSGCSTGIVEFDLGLNTVLLASNQNPTKRGETADQILCLLLYVHAQTGHHTHRGIVHTSHSHCDMLFRLVCETWLYKQPARQCTVRRTAQMRSEHSLCTVCKLSQS